MKSILFVVLLLVTFTSVARAENDITIHRDRVYHRIGDRALTLDLYLPKSDKPTPLVIWIHGGGWRNGNKNGCPITWLNGHGYAVASISYRLSGEAIHPAQIHDCKAALVALRAKAAEYNIDPDHIAVSGSSAGGHLANILGTSAGVTALRGDAYPGVDDRVQAVIAFCGPTDLTGIKVGAVSLMLGGEDKQAEAVIASPVTHIDSDDPPFMLIHGDNDPVVPVEQAKTFAEKIKAADVTAELHLLEGVGHSAQVFMHRGNGKTEMITFLDRYMK